MSGGDGSSSRLRRRIGLLLGPFVTDALQGQPGRPEAGASRLELTFVLENPLFDHGHPSDHMPVARAVDLAQSFHASNSTVPRSPSTRIRSPSRSRMVALPVPTTAGMPSSRATIEACDSGAPMSVTTAAARG